MHLIVGLGNPGPDYAGHRHNVGFMAVDAIARRHSFPPFRQKFSGLLSEGVIDGEKVLLLKPQTYMNRSGDCVGQAAKFYKLEPADISVIHDELDLAPGKVRIKSGGGNGGHNGLKSIDAHVGNAFRRVRIGIGHPGHKGAVNPHVLSDFHKIDHTWLDPLLEALGDHAALLARGDTSALMNKLALALPQEDETAPDATETAPKRPRGQSHVRQARQTRPQAQVPETGPMAAMLRKIFKDKG